MTIKRYLLFILIYIICNYANALQATISENSSYEELSNSYLKLRYSNPKLAKLQAENLLKKAISEANVEQEHKGYLYLGAVESYLGNREKSLGLVNKSIVYAKAQQNTKLLLEALNESGKINFNFGTYRKALSEYLKVDSIALATNNYAYQLVAEQNIGILKTEIGEYREAVGIFRKRIKRLKSLPEQNKTSITNALIAISSAYARFNADSALYYNKKIKTNALNNNDIDGLNYYYILEGVAHYEKQAYDTALLFLEDADSLAKTLSGQAKFFSIYRFKGKCFFEKQQYNRAISNFEKINELQKTIKFKHIELQEVSYLLANSYEKIGDIDNAIINFNKSLELAKKNEQLKSDIKNDILQQYSISKLEKKIIELTNFSKKKRISNIRLILVSVILFLGICSILIVYKRRDKQNKIKFNSVLSKLKDLENKTNDHNVKPKQSVSISDEKLTILINRLNKFETEEQYLSAKTSLSTVAKKLKTNTLYLSKIINDIKGQSFSNYIMELRINHALLQLKQDSVFRSYSIKAIAKDLGFKSEGSFSRAFKRQTGLYPSFYIKKITSNL